MTDFAPDAPLSTTLSDEALPAASGGGAPPAPPADEPVKRESIRDSLEKASQQVKDEAAKEIQPKDDAPDKDAPKADEKPAEKPKAEEAAKEEPKAGDAKDGEAAPKPSEGRKQVEAPARLLPKEREAWKHVPHELRSGLERLAKEDEAEITRHKEAAERYTELRDYDELARSNGTTLRDAVDKYHKLENLVRENPLAGLNQILMESGLKKADGQPVSLWELANAITKSGQDQYSQIVGQRQQEQQPQTDPRVQQLEQQLQEMKVEQLRANIIEPFKAQHTRYDELSPYIANLLQSDMIPATLGPLDRLAHAYDMAERLYPAAQYDDRGSQSDTDPGGMSNGSKSIKSTPGAATDTYSDDGKAVSIREAIERAGKKVSLRG